MKIPRNSFFPQTIFSGSNYIDFPQKPIKLSENDRFCPDKKSYKSFLYKRSKFTVENYHLLSDEAKEQIRAKAGEDLIDIATTNVNLALNLKENLDKLYGEDRYIFVSIGTSPSLIGKAMEFSGVEVKYLPMSGLASPEITDKKIKETDLTNYKKFLKSQGLSFMDGIKSQKKILFYDYTRSGASLEKYKEIIKRTTHIPMFKTEFRSLNNDLFACCNEEDDEVVEYISTFLENSAAGQFSSINSLPFELIDRLLIKRRTLSNHDNESTKIFNFLTADALNNYGQLKENSANANVL